MRFATRMLLVQVATQVAVVAVCAAVFLWLGVQQLRAETETSALNIARTVAESPQVQELVEEYSADPGTPRAEGLRDGVLQRYAAEVTARTDGLFVVITDDNGIRLAHPNPDRLGEVVSTSFEEALSGQEVVTWETGTLGESARAKVPVFPPAGGAPVGEVSVGFERASVFDDLPALVGGIALAMLAAVGIGLAVAVLMRRRLEKLTLGVQPEELVALVQTQTAVLDGSGDGVVAVDERGVVRVWTSAAGRMLGSDDAVGRPLAELALPPLVGAALAGTGASDGIPIGERVVYVDVRAVSRGGRALGTVAVLRDRTDLVSLSQRLDSVRTMGDALRVQRHENANRLHAAVGLLDAGRSQEAREFLADLADRGAGDDSVPGGDAVADPALRSFLGAKALAARERGVALRMADDAFVRGVVDDLEDVVGVVGNLVDNAVTAAARGAEPRWVEVTLLDDGDALVATVSDSGAGIAAPADVFVARAADDAPASAVHGLGIGLPLSRELARRRGGEVWIVDAGGGGHGAVLAARLPGTMAAPDAPGPSPTPAEPSGIPAPGAPGTPAAPHTEEDR